MITLNDSLLIEGGVFNERKTEFFCQKCGGTEFMEKRSVMGVNYYSKELECECCGNPVKLYFPYDTIQEEEVE